MKKLYTIMLIIAVALFISCDEKKAEDDIKKAFTKITDKASDVVDAVDKATPKLTKPVFSQASANWDTPITFPKVAGYTYGLKGKKTGISLSETTGNRMLVTATQSAQGVIIVATFDGNSIDSEPIDFLLYVANKKALQDEIKTAKTESEYGSNVNLNYIDTSDITDMSELFKDDTTFNGDVSKWNTSSVTTMSEMFSGASAFNQSLNSWNVSKVTDMYRMFYKASSFNQPLNNWDVSSVGDMESMFSGARVFNQDISGWKEWTDDENERHTDGMFYGATAMQESHKPRLSSWVR